MLSTPHTHRSWIARLLAVVVVTAGLALVVGPPPAARAADDGGFSAKMLELVNQHRAGAGLAPLRVSADLAAAAQDGRYDGCGFPVMGRATDMGNRNYFSHSILGCPSPQGVTQLLGALGVEVSSTGENIAWMNGTTDPVTAATRLTNDLMASPGHRANILSTNFTHVGIGSWRTAPGQTWSGGGYALPNVFVAAQVFGRVTGTTAAPQVPGAPTAVQATGGDGRVEVSWAPPAGGPVANHYGAFVWNAAGYTGSYAVVCSTCRSATVTGLANGGPYYVTVQGHNPAGWGVTATSKWVTVAAKPHVPAGVTAVPGLAAVTTTWAAPTAPGTAIDGHAVFIFDDDGYTERYAWVCATCTSATVTGLVNGRTYRSVVFAHNPNGWSDPAISGFVVAGTPGPPGRVAVTRGNGSVGVSWSAAATPGPAVDAYGLFAFDANGYTGIYSVACATCTAGTVPGLVNGRSYTIAVFPHNVHGWGVPVMSTPVVPSAT